MASTFDPGSPAGTPTLPETPELLPVPAAALRPGQLVAGRYEIAARLGAGGMGSVWRAHDRSLDEQVALKVILPERLADPRALSRFRGEVKLGRRITHPSVCRVFDLGEDAGLVFLTMELVDGGTLRDLLAAGPLEPARALDLFDQIVAGVAAMHAQGIVHRDLKPENVLVRRDGRALVTDFGLAVEPAERSRASATLAGTPMYMSPEQLRGEPLDARSDVFALGILGYELLAGRTPFREGSPAVAGVAILQEAPRPLAVPGLPAPALEAVRALLGRALAKAPSERFASAADLGEALSLARAGRAEKERRSTLRGLARMGPQPPPRPGSRAGWTWPRAFVAAVGLTVLGVVVLDWNRLRHERLAEEEEEGEERAEEKEPAAPHQRADDAEVDAGAALDAGSPALTPPSPAARTAPPAAAP